MKHLEIIEDYLAGDLQEAQAMEFEARLGSDPRLRRELAIVKDIDESLSDNEILDLRKAIHEMMVEEQNARVSRRRLPAFVPYVAAAASIAILVGSAILFFSRPPVNERLFNSNYETYPSLYNTRSASITNDEVVVAMLPYDLGDFATADANLAALLERDPSRADLSFYKGICQIELGNYQAAVDLFNTVRHSDYVLLYEQSTWYSGLALMKAGDKEAAEKEFQTLVDEHSSFSERAEHILRKLR